MTPISIGLLAVGMSIDAFVAALGRGAQAGRPGLRLALRTGAVFGAVEAVTPLIGWALGMAASQSIRAVDHWVAFVLLGGVGARMALHALRRPPEAAPPAPGGWALIATAIGTSVDAMAVGVSLAFLQVNILVMAAAIGLATLSLSTTGMMTGHLLGARFGRRIEVLGGLLLIGLGASILYEHLSAG